jgi:hypothetical protein
MKFHIITLLFLAFFLLAKAEEVVDVDNKWNISDPTTFFCDENSDIVQRFDVSVSFRSFALECSCNMRLLTSVVSLSLEPITRKNAIGESNVGYSITRYDASGECTIDITDNIYFNPIMVFDGIPYLGDGSGDRQIAMAFEADQDILLSSPIFYPESGEVPAHIRFFSQLRLYDHNGMLVNWSDVEYVQNMDVGGSTGFRCRKCTGCRDCVGESRGQISKTSPGMFRQLYECV